MCDALRRCPLILRTDIGMERPEQNRIDPCSAYGEVYACSDFDVLQEAVVVVVVVVLLFI